MASTLKFLREDLIGGALSKIDSVLPELPSFQLENTTFTKLAILVGLGAAVKGAWWALKSLVPRPTRPSKDPRVLINRYG